MEFNLRLLLKYVKVAFLSESCFTCVLPHHLLQPIWHLALQSWSRAIAPDYLCYTVLILPVLSVTHKKKQNQQDNISKPPKSKYTCSDFYLEFSCINCSTSTTQTLQFLLSKLKLNTTQLLCDLPVCHLTEQFPYLKQLEEKKYEATLL